MLNFFTYWWIAGIACFVWANLPTPPDRQEKINELLEQVPLPPEQVQILCSLISLLLGGVIIPIVVINSIYKSITGEDLI